MKLIVSYLVCLARCIYYYITSRGSYIINPTRASLHAARVPLIICVRAPLGFPRVHSMRIYIYIPTALPPCCTPCACGGRIYIYTMRAPDRLPPRSRSLRRSFQGFFPDDSSYRCIYTRRPAVALVRAPRGRGFCERERE